MAGIRIAVWLCFGNNMSTRSSSIAPSNASNALYSAWVNEIYNSLIAFGWVQTSDTGQSTFGGTLTAPVGINTYPDVGIFRMDDSLQSTAAVFMRLDFGEAATADNCGLKITVGIGGTNGAGTLTGTVMPQQTIVAFNGPTASAVVKPCYTSGTSSSFAMNFWNSGLTNTPSIVLYVERDRDTNGNETDDGVNIVGNTQYANTGANLYFSFFLETGGGVGAVETKLMALMSPQSTQSAGGLVGVAPVRCALGPLRNPMLTCLMYARTDFTDQTQNPVTIYGASHNYLMLRPGPAVCALIHGLNLDPGIAMLWE